MIFLDLVPHTAHAVAVDEEAVRPAAGDALQAIVDTREIHGLPAREFILQQAVHLGAFADDRTAQLSLQGEHPAVLWPDHSHDHRIGQRGRDQQVLLLSLIVAEICREHAVDLALLQSIECIV